MENINITLKKSSEVKLSLNVIHKTVFKLYIFLLPVSMLNILKPIQEFVPEALANDTNFILHFFGILLLIITILNKSKLHVNSLIKYLFIFITLINLISLAMAFILNNKLGILHGEDTYIATSGMILYYFHSFFVIYYNFVNFKLLTLLEIKDILKKISIYLIIIGYIQILIISNFPSIGTLYDKFDVFDILKDSEWLRFQQRITLTGSEPSLAGNILTILVFPFILSQLIKKNNVNTYLCLFILSLPILYFTKSSTAYMQFGVNILLSLALYFKKINYKTILSTLFLLICFTIFLLNYTNQQSSSKDSLEDVEYLLLEKAFDKNNLSTVYRSTTVINDIKVFYKYPILGIGNGNQGFYYNQNLPSWAFESDETILAYQGYLGVINGGPFIPAFVSGYGIIGIILLLIFIIKCMRTVKKNKTALDNFYYMYIIGSISFLVSGIMANDIVGNFLALFILSIPFIDINKLKK